MNRWAIAFFYASVAMTAAANQSDTNFLDGMTMHHKDGSEMAEIAIRKASSAELRQLAQKIRDEQQKDIAEFERLRSGNI